MSAPLLAGVAGVVDRNQVTAWMAAVLAACGLQLGVNKLPAEHLAPDTSGARWPFLILDDIPGGSVWPGLAGDGSAAALVYQVRCVGLRDDQARAGRHRVDLAVLGRTAVGWAVDPDPGPDLVIAGREYDDVPDACLDVAGVEPNQKWTASTRFRIHAVTGMGAG